ncbi:MAG: hypothetical protein AB7V16_14425 [Vulcanibacillus sp.]
MKKLTLKDYLIIYLIILVIVSFIAGFFIGARAMKNEINNYTNYTDSQETEKVYLENEIEIFCNQIFLLAQTFNSEVFYYLNKNEEINEGDQELLITTGENILINYELSTFESPNLANSIDELTLNISLLLELINSYNPDQVSEVVAHYLSGQKEFYRSLWIWEQSLKAGTKIVKECSTDWKTWTEGSLHQKNYIVSTILENNSIKTFYRPEDITVHIDSFIYNEDNKTSISLEDLIKLLISSDSINEKDFIDYLNMYPDWYSSDVLPDMSIFK